MKHITIAVIGGTGKSGKFVVEKLLRQQFHLRLLVRNPEKTAFKNDHITFVQGDARDYAAVDKLLHDCQAVVSTLGQPAGEPSIFSDATRTILEAMQKNGLKRYIVTTGLSVDTPSDTKHEQTKAATEWMYAHYPETTLDKQKEYELLAKSTIDWTLIRLPLIRETPNGVGFTANLTDCKGTSIIAADLGAFIVDEIVQGNYVQQAPFLYND